MSDTLTITGMFFLRWLVRSWHTTCARTRSDQVKFRNTMRAASLAFVRWEKYYVPGTPRGSRCPSLYLWAGGASVSCRPAWRAACSAGTRHPAGSASPDRRLLAIRPAMYLGQFLSQHKIKILIFMFPNFFARLYKQPVSPKLVIWLGSFQLYILPSIL